MENREQAAPAVVNAAQGQRPYKRRLRSILIHKAAQREFTFVVMALMMVTILAIGFLINETIRSTAYAGFHFGSINPSEVLTEANTQIIFRVSCVLFLSFFIIIAFGVVFLHRMAGPAYRFRLAMIKINEGQLPNPIKLREGDFFVEVANELNALIKTLEDNKDKRAAAMGKLNKMISENPPSAMLPSLQELKKLLQNEPV